MPTLHKINFDTNDNNYLLYEEKKIKKEFFDISLFNLPHSQDYLSVFILLEELNKDTHAQLINCISSIKLQSFHNIKISVINLDTNIKNKNLVKKIGIQTDCNILEINSNNILEAIEDTIKNCQSKYITLIEASDIIPRTKDIENCINILFRNDYDYLSHTIIYKDKNGNDFNYKTTSSTLKSSQNKHYGAFFKTSILKNYKFINFATSNIDEKMIINFEKNNHHGNHLISETEMNFIEYLRTNEWKST